MKLASWACSKAALLLALACQAPAAWALTTEIVRPRTAQVVATDTDVAPAAALRGAVVDLPHMSTLPSLWYRIEFDAPATRPDTWAVYLPYLYGGGDLLLNGSPVMRIASSTGTARFRWERPFLIPLPNAALQSGRNVLLVRAVAEPTTGRVRLPVPLIGEEAQLVPIHDRRLFLVRTMPQITVMACVLLGSLVLYIWWRRREEQLYGLFGLGALLWGVRTLSMLVETVPAAWWPAWRLMYHSATGGFIIVLFVFALRLAARPRKKFEVALFVFWLLGPVGYVLSGGNEVLVSRVWTGFLVPIGSGIVVLSALAAWRQRSPTLKALCAAIALAMVAGVNDYLLASPSTLLAQLAPDWAGQRIFMLHYAANLILLAMGAILSARFVATLHDLALLNQTLEARVADRERALGENFTRMGHLERRHAADEERQRIMRDLHDGLGSQLFVTLNRVENGEIEQGRIAQALRACIADMRLALEAMGAHGSDFLEAWSDFRFRWESQLETAGVRSTWTIVTRNDVLGLPPHAGLQLLRIAQEALTNVLKHAAAQHVEVTLRENDGRVQLVVHDDGVGVAETGRPGRGLANMRTRAARLGGELRLDGQGAGTRLCFAFTPAGVSQPGALARVP